MLTINLGLSAVATGTADVITATYSPAPTLVDKKILFLTGCVANTVTNPTFSPNGLTAHDIVSNGLPVLAGDVLGNVIIQYDLANTRWELLTPKAFLAIVTQDIIEAIQGSSAPSGANPFATIGDLPALQGLASVLGVGNSADGTWRSVNGKSTLNVGAADISVNFNDGAISASLVINGGSTSYSWTDGADSGNVSIDSTVLFLGHSQLINLVAPSVQKNGSEIATQSYVDGKVIDSIADSDTTHAPSRNAVFDSLALKVNLAGGDLSGPVNANKGTNIASATTTDLGSATGEYIHVTGTTTITSFGTAQAGTLRHVVFDGALTITNNANIITLTGANRVTSANDVMIIRSEGGGVWRVVSYTSYSGFPINPIVYIAIVGTSVVSNPVDSTTRYTSIFTTLDANATATARDFKLPTGVLRSATFHVDPTLIVGSNENVGYYLRNVTDGVSYFLGNLTYNSRGNGVFIEGLSVATSSTKEYALEMVYPAWATNPTAVITTGRLIIYKY